MTVALFITCLTDTFFPRVGVAVVRVLRHFGCRVEFPAGQTCCGQPAYNSGFRDEAAGAAERTMRLFAGFEHVVAPSASCVSMIGHYGELFEADATLRAAAADLRARTREFAVFLRDVLHVDIAALLKFPEPATYHFACHARSSYQPSDLHNWLAAPDGLLRPPARADLCCGFGGAFAVEFAQVSDGMLADKLDALSASGARLVVCNEGGCAMQIEGGARRRGAPLRCVHLAELLAESLGLLTVGR